MDSNGCETASSHTTDRAIQANDGCSLPMGIAATSLRKLSPIIWTMLSIYSYCHHIARIYSSLLMLGCSRHLSVPSPLSLTRPLGSILAVLPEWNGRQYTSKLEIGLLQRQTSEAAGERVASSHLALSSSSISCLRPKDPPRLRLVSRATRRPSTSRFSQAQHQSALSYDRRMRW